MYEGLAQWGWPVSLAALFFLLGLYARIVYDRIRAAASENSLERLVEDAQQKAEDIIRDAELKAKDEAIAAQHAFDAECQNRRQDLVALEERVVQRERNLDRMVDMLDTKEKNIDRRWTELETRREDFHKKETELEGLIARQKEACLKIAGLTEESARRLYLEGLEESLRDETAALIRRSNDLARERAVRDAQQLVAMAIERHAVDQINELTTSVVSLPNEEMKGRIIGREGRNIRSLETLTGCNLLIDDIPEAVVISGFDPLRREIARRALEQLLADGRIHPARIEEVVTKAQAEVDEILRKAGEDAVLELNLTGVASDLIPILGRLKFRHSYSQNALTHSMETARLMGMMAAEMGLNESLAKRVGLFHDIGKALDHTMEGNHAQIGADLLKQHGESPLVWQAVGAHHGEQPPESVYAHLATAADAITAARPGARLEATAIYLKRLEKLEAIANSFKGVQKTYAVQAGREIRVFVEPSQVDDAGALLLARNIGRRIVTEMQYPGQIRVVVVREVRCVEYAR